MDSKPSLTYRDAGVDIDAGNELVERIKPAVAATRRPEVLSGLGGFGGLFALPVEGFRQPVLVSGTDGVGTKLKLAIELARHDTIGIDLVAMCVNDVLVTGAQPLFFLDYYATPKLVLDDAEAVIRGIAEGCRQAGAALIGGETAELPGLYAKGDYDLAGFCVGVVEREDIIDGSAVAAGDRLIGIASSGPHSNGYSLIRKVLEIGGKPMRAALQEEVEGRPLGELLLEPTRIYVKSVLGVLDKIEVHALAHITGGGLPENLPRVLPEGCAARVDAGAWSRGPVFDWIQRNGGIADKEMYRTFNCGIGMVLVVSPQDAATTLELLGEAGETAWEIGEVSEGAREVSLC